MDNTIAISILESLQAILESLKTQTVTDIDSAVMNTKGAAKYLNVSEELLKKARSTGLIGGDDDVPLHFEVGASVKYQVKDLDDYLERRPKYKHAAQKRKKRNEK